MANIPVEQIRSLPGNPNRGSAALPSLQRNFSWTFLGSTVYSACNWLLILEIAKLGTPKLVGQYAIGQAVTLPILLFAQLQLRYVQVTDQTHSYRFRDYIGLRVIALFLAMAAIAAVTCKEYAGEMAAVIMAMGLFGSVEALSDIYYGLMQKNERMETHRDLDGIARTAMARSLGDRHLHHRGRFLGNHRNVACLGARISVF